MASYFTCTRKTAHARMLYMSVLQLLLVGESQSAKFTIIQPIIASSASVNPQGSST